MTETTIPPCPQCGAALPPPAGFPQWCEACEWNLSHVETGVRPTALGRVYARLGEHLGDALFANVMRGEDLRPHRTWASSAALMLAALIYVCAALFALGGVSLLWVGWPNPIAILIGAVLIGASWVARPRIASAPANVLDRSQFPAMYALVDRVADALGAPRVAGVTVSAEFNAGVWQAGWRGDRYLEIGLPLYAVLTPQARVAVLAHEFAHFVNGDPLRSRVLHNALRQLFLWIHLIRPDAIWDRSGSSNVGPFVALAMIPINIALMAVALALTALGYALVALVFRDSQRAEYLADRLATQVSGAAAMQASLEAMLKAESFEWVAHRYSNYRQPDQKLFDTLRAYVSNIPAREVERRHRLARRLKSRVDDTHPPTMARIEFVRVHGHHAAAITLSEEEVLHIDVELRPLEPEITQLLVSRYNEALWR